MVSSQELQDAILEYVTAPSAAVKQIQRQWRRSDLQGAVRAGAIPRASEHERRRVSFHGSGVRIECDELLLAFDIDVDGNPKLPPNP